MRVRQSFFRLAVLVITLSSRSVAHAQRPTESQSIDPATRAEVIEVTLKHIRESYVFPEVAKKIENAVRERLNKKEYDRITSPEKLAEVLTTEVRAISHDKHMSISYYAKPLPPPPSQDKQTPEEREKSRRLASLSNFGFNKVARLPGNVGYLDLNIFWWLDVGGGDTAAAAMRFLTDTSAMIIDLRENRGGDPAMVALTASYFFDSEPVELTGLYWRHTDSVQRSFTLPYIPGRRYLNKDVYVLTSKDTFSAGEAFAYDLKNLKRAAIVGETTAGGANPRTGYPINPHFIVFVPTGRALNPITKTNWEGVGVKPDIEVPADVALATAHLMALKKLLERNSEPSLEDEMRKAIVALQAEIDVSKKR